MHINIMRLVQIYVPVGMRQLVQEVLDFERIDYAISDETSGKGLEALVQFPISSIGVELVLEKLRKAGLSDDAYKIILVPENVISSHTKTLKQRYSGTRISREELILRAEELASDTSTYLAFIILSAIMATGGLLLDSAATVIGAMVVAPLMGPAISASIGTVLNDRKLASRGIKLQVVGLLLAIATAAVIGILLKNSVLVSPNLDIAKIPQISERTDLTFISLFLALCTGTAGALSVIRSGGATLVGVAIAIALIPPAAASGLGLAWGLPNVAITAAVILLVNLLAINVSALIMLWISGFRPRDMREVKYAQTAVFSHIIFLCLHSFCFLQPLHWRPILLLRQI
jgi:uncharacterized hydrophobic protein (TIGR00341 family)